MSDGNLLQRSSHMRKWFVGLVLVAVLGATPARADDFTVDAVHSSVTFKISHLGLSFVHGRFNEFSGGFTLDADAGKCAFNLAIKVDSIDTNNSKRDEHLRSPDFFNAKQFSAISFKSTGVKAIKDGYEVKGDLTMHGVTKPVTFALVGGRKAEFPKGVQRTGFSTDLMLKRSEFGMDKFADALGDEVHIAVSFEGTRR
jgi:polyisoprenoid-binding protein YceI